MCPSTVLPFMFAMFLFITLTHIINTCLAAVLTVSNGDDKAFFWSLFILSISGLMVFTSSVATFVLIKPMCSYKRAITSLDRKKFMWIIRVIWFLFSINTHVSWIELFIISFIRYNSILPLFVKIIHTILIVIVGLVCTVGLVVLSIKCPSKKAILSDDPTYPNDIFSCCHKCWFQHEIHEYSSFPHVHKSGHVFKINTDSDEEMEEV